MAATLLASACARAAGVTGPSITIYRSDDAALFGHDGSPADSGYAMVRENRRLDLKAGMQDVSVGGLPRLLDPEALSLHFPADDARVLWQRLQRAQDASAALSELVGRDIDVLGTGGNVMFTGRLISARDGLELRQGDATVLVHDYAAVRASGPIDHGARLDLRVDARRAGSMQARLGFVTAGLGWRASYIGTLAPGPACRMTLESRASVANRSGSEWRGADLTLVAGEPNLARPEMPGPRMMAASAKAAGNLPGQSTLADYRSYHLPDRIDLPDGSVSLLPLYATRTLACQRTALYESGNTYAPPMPLIQPDVNPGGQDRVTSTLDFDAFDSLPAGYLRVLAGDAQGTPQVIGEGRIQDTPRGGKVTLALGTAFDLRVRRERTAFHVDRRGRTMDEAFRLTLTNAGNTTRVVTVREHPSRWRTWTLTSSSQKPRATMPDTLVFDVNVPAHGKATLDYAVQYTWTSDVQPR
ncbi:MAG: DUF4139 domain-containing protein [Xanthomonadaceae bacterium]|nr:DUF4139 domain-containing protein [Xanthomonadaceae bacterium]MDE1965252.1 DUF4139 domain-containing protein [Xanthomonadaceae bacterium]